VLLRLRSGGYRCRDFTMLACGRRSHRPHKRIVRWHSHDGIHASTVATVLKSAYKLSEDFAKPYFHKYWTEIHDVTAIWNRNVCSFIVALNAFDVRPQSGTSYKTCFRWFGGNGSIAWTSAVSHVGRTSNAFKVTMKLQTFLFQMVVTSCISVQYLWKYGFAKSSNNLYALCI